MDARMAARKANQPTLGERLRQLREERGFSLREFSKIIGISYRMIHYYEANEGSPSADILLQFATALEVSADQLLGLEPLRNTKKRKTTPENVRLLRRLRQVESLPAKERRTVLQLIDALVQGHQLKQAQE
jgi:transcriptional regulator with XRE-family HTH domain